MDGLKSLEYRGYDSWGIAVLDQRSNIKDQRLSKAKILVKKKAGKIGEATVSDLPQSNFALGHTRWATHGGVTDINAHPHLDCTSNLAIIHNGIIENYLDIRNNFKKKHKIISQTDTELIVHLLEENIKVQPSGNIGSSMKAFRDSFNSMNGLNAIIVMDAERKVFYVAKNGSPLVLGEGKNGNYIASDAHAIIPHTNKVYFMKDEEMAVISENEMKVFGTKTGKEIKIDFTRLDWKESSVDKGNYPHFMLKEIFDQPDIIETIARDGENQIMPFVKLIKNSFGTYLVGCGTAYYACLAGNYIFSKIGKRHVNNAIGSEFVYSLDFLTEKSLVLALSQSGETIDVIESVKRAKEQGATIGTLVNVLGSTLYRLADYKLLLGAGVEKAVVCTKAFTAKLAYLILLAYQLAGKLKEGQGQLEEASEAIRYILSDKGLEPIRELSGIIYRKENVYVIGRGLSYPIALETALKIKESSYIHAEGFAAGELKHGVIALIEKNTPCIVFLPNDETYNASLAGAMEMKVRGGYIIGVSYRPHEIFDYYLPSPDCGTASLIPAIVTGQLLGYFLSVKKGINPDMPRNLAKSVTVK